MSMGKYGEGLSAEDAFIFLTADREGRKHVLDKIIAMRSM
jgi:hypothetical protein